MLKYHIRCLKERLRKSLKTSSGTLTKKEPTRKENQSGMFIQDSEPISSRVRRKILMNQPMVQIEIEIEISLDHQIAGLCLMTEAWNQSLIDPAVIVRLNTPQKTKPQCISGIKSKPNSPIWTHRNFIMSRFLKTI